MGLMMRLSFRKIRRIRDIHQQLKLGSTTFNSPHVDSGRVYLKLFGLKKMLILQRQLSQHLCFILNSLQPWGAPKYHNDHQTHDTDTTIKLMLYQSEYQNKTQTKTSTNLLLYRSSAEDQGSISMSRRESVTPGNSEGESQDPLKYDRRGKAGSARLTVTTIISQWVLLLCIPVLSTLPSHSLRIIMGRQHQQMLKAEVGENQDYSKHTYY